MTILNDDKPAITKPNEVVIDMSQFVSQRKNTDPHLQDIDRGIKLLSEALFAHAETDHHYEQIITDLIAENERNQMLLEKYKGSEKRWNTWKWVGAGLTVVTIAIVLFADLFDQSLNTREGPRMITRRVLISVGAFCTALTASFTGVSYKMEGKKHNQYKRRLGLQLEDNEMVKKLRIVLENWGALQRTQEDYLSEVDVNKCAKRCFKNIKELPDNKELPAKSCMASMTLELLNENHPAKKAANKIIELEEQLSPRDLSEEKHEGFRDLGQKGSLDFSSNPSGDELEIAYQWKQLQQEMGGLYIDEFYHDKHRICRRDTRMMMEH